MMAIKTYEQALAWVFSLRNTYLSFGEDPCGLDMKMQPQCRETGAFENIPLVAIEHQRLSALWGSAQVLKDIGQQLDLIQRMDQAGRKLLAVGWSPLQLTANALNKTEDCAKAYVEAGYISLRYGLPA